MGDAFAACAYTAAIWADRRMQHESETGAKDSPRGRVHA
jgi:hypothetical protein